MSTEDVMSRAGFPLDDELLWMLGAITALGSLIDAAAEGLIAGLVGDFDWIPSLTNTAGCLNGQLLNDLERKCAERDGGEDVAAWVTEARDSMSRRNALVHAAWIMRWVDNPVGTHSKRGGVRFVEVHDRQEFADVASLLRQVYNDGIGVANQLYANRSG